ncbi:hypothetical protein Pfo_022319 [Paulownia fortunei]|nr:hypothetical protein Pfo_022319 [Paulownia fortunei]
MKFFSEFGSCWGGAMVSPAAEAADGGRQAEEQGRYCHAHPGPANSKRLAKVKPKGGGISHWKPKLNAISEDSPTLEGDRGGVNRRTAGVNDNKRPVKVKPKSSAKAAPPPSHGEDYWTSSHTMALPAFSPTSFLF